MAIQFVGYATGGSLDTTAYSISLTSLTGGIGSAPIAGDVVVLVNTTVNGSTDTDLTTSSGYTELADLNQIETWYVGMYVGYKVMGATPDTSITGITAANDTNGGSGGIAYVLRGVDPVTPIDVAIVTAQGANSYIPNAPSITPVTAGALVIAMGGSSGIAFGRSLTHPAGYSNGAHKISDTTAADSMTIMASKVWAGGAEDPAAFGVTIADPATYSADLGWCAATLALRPKPVNAGNLFFGSNF